MGLLSLKDQATGRRPGIKPPHSGEMDSAAVQRDRIPTGRPVHGEILEEISQWSPERRLEWEERAGIREFDGLLRRDEAETRAYFDVMGERMKDE